MNTNMSTNPNRLYHITNNVYLSNLHSALDTNLLRDNNIKIVCRLSEDNNEIPLSYRSMNIEFFNFEMEDNFMFSKEIIKYSQLIYYIITANPNKNVLVHCNEGQSRSVSAIINYICRLENITVEAALIRIKIIKKDVRPTNEFLHELKKIYNKGYAKTCANKQPNVRKIVELQGLREWQVDSYDSTDNLISEESIIEEEYMRESLKILYS